LTASSRSGLTVIDLYVPTIMVISFIAIAVSLPNTLVRDRDFSSCRGCGFSRYRSVRTPGALHPFLQRINTYLMRWIRKKYKRLKAYRKAQAAWQRS
jgi:hypothetical protein